ncbi:MAG: bile acid:sodium symporter [Pseudomonas sp.]|nr:bile acid:sodium symporter [Pseudomonas sp.]
MARSRLLPDNFTLTLIAVVATATLLPAQGQVAVAFSWITNIAISLLFFLHGAKLSRSAVIEGAGHWRLHLLIFICTFGLFPLLGLTLKPVLMPMVGPELYAGFLYVCVLPATVQSAIAFTSLARGNIPAAICSAAASSLVGIFITPVLVALLMGVHSDGSSTIEAIRKISIQLLLPFIAGQIARRWVGDWVNRNKVWLKNVDQGSILLVVYTAFSSAVIGGLWQQVPALKLLGVMFGCSLLLALALLVAQLLGKWLGFNLEDRITILFCGSKKSLATGVPMAQVLFAGSSIGVLILPLMLFHQIQLMVCAVLAQRYAKRPELSPLTSPSEASARS